MGFFVKLDAGGWETAGSLPYLKPSPEGYVNSVVSWKHDGGGAVEVYITLAAAGNGTTPLGGSFVDGSYTISYADLDVYTARYLYLQPETLAIQYAGLTTIWVFHYPYLSNLVTVIDSFTGLPVENCWISMQDVGGTHNWFTDASGVAGQRNVVRWQGRTYGSLAPPAGYIAPAFGYFAGSDVDQTAIISLDRIPVTANFTATPLTGVTKYTVTFTNSSYENPLDTSTYLWDFGDGTTSTLKNPTHLYQPVPHNFATPIKYTVTLTASNLSSTSTKTRVDYITVNPGVANFTATPLTQTLPQYTSFTQSSTCFPIDFLWDFGDGTTSTLSYPIHQYPGIGTYTVTLLVHDSDGYDWFIERVNYIVIGGDSVGSAVIIPSDDENDLMFATTAPAVGSKGVMLPNQTFLTQGAGIAVGNKVLSIPDKGGQLQILKPLTVTPPSPPTPTITISSVTPSSVSKDAGVVEFVVIGLRFDDSPILSEHAILSLLTKSIVADYVDVIYYNELHIGFTISGFTVGSATLTLTNDVGTTNHIHITMT